MEDMRRSIPVDLSGIAVNCEPVFRDGSRDDTHRGDDASGPTARDTLVLDEHTGAAEDLKDAKRKHPPGKDTFYITAEKVAGFCVGPNLVAPDNQAFHCTLPAGRRPGSVQDVHANVTLLMPDLHPVLERDLVAKRARGEPNDILLYVHGWHEEHRSAMVTASVLPNDAGQGVPGAPVQVAGAFLWNTMGSYSKVRATLYANAERLAIELEGLLRVADTARSVIHLHAHSMGANLVMEALNEMARRAGAPVCRRFGRIALAHPDILWRDFAAACATPNVVLPEIRPHADADPDMPFLNKGGLLALAGGKASAPLDLRSAFNAVAAALLGGETMQRVSCTVYYHSKDTALWARAIKEGGLVAGDSVGFGSVPDPASGLRLRPIGIGIEFRRARCYLGILLDGIEFVHVLPIRSHEKAALPPLRHSDAYTDERNTRDFGVWLWTGGLAASVRLTVTTQRRTVVESLVVAAGMFGPFNLSTITYNAHEVKRGIATPPWSVTLSDMADFLR